MTDLIIRDAALAAIEGSPEIDGAAVGVTVHRGVVTLTGRLGSFAEKAAVSRAALRAVGVRGVANEVDVCGAEETYVADEVIAARIADFFRATAAAGGVNAKVEVDHGWVHLSGAVDRTDRREAIERYARLGEGVLGVENRLHLRRADAR